MRPTIPLADVEVFGGLAGEGEMFRKCRLGMNGKPASVVMYSKLIGDGKWKAVDTLRQADIVEHDDGSLTIKGESQELIQVVGLAPAESIVRWEVSPLGCRNCH